MATIQNLDNNFVRSDGAAVRVDAGQDAHIVLGSTALTYLYFDTQNVPFSSATESLGIVEGTGPDSVHLSGGVTFGSKIFVGTVEIGRVELIDYVGRNSIRMSLNANATAPLVDILIRSLTYTNTGEPTLETQKVSVTLFDGEGSVASTIFVADVPSTAIRLESNKNSVGTGFDDLFFADSTVTSVDLAGGGGHDVLVLKSYFGQFDPIYLTTSSFRSFTGIEEVRGTSSADQFHVDSAYFGGILKFDGGATATPVTDTLSLDGDNTTFDFTGKIVANFDQIILHNDQTVTFSDKATAMLAVGNGVHEEIILTGAERFTDDERTILVNAGIEVITDGSKTTGNQRPVMAGLDGDVIQVAAGQKVLLDQGGQFTISDDGRMIQLRVQVYVDENNHLGLDAFGSATSGVYLPGGFVQNGKVWVDGNEIGNLTVVAANVLTVDFFNNVTPAQIEALVHNLTYLDDDGAFINGPPVYVYVTDAGFRAATSIVQVAGSNIPPGAAPDSVALNGTSVVENAGKDTVVGTLSATDPDTASNALTYTLRDDAGGRFYVSGNQLLVKNGALLDYELAQSHAITIRVTDDVGHRLDQVFTITLTDVPDNHIPTALSLSDTTVAENAAADTVIGTVSGTDPDGDPLTYALLDDAGGRFVLNGSQLVVKNGALLDYETAHGHSIKLQAMDPNGYTFEKVFTIAITDVPDERPTGLFLSASAVAENAVVDTVIGTVSGTDPEGDPLTYALLDDAGGRFALKGNQLVVKNGALLDYEAAHSHTIKLQVKDSKGYVLEKVFTIGVTDVAEAKNLIGTAGADTLTGDSLNDILSGLGGKDSLFGLSGNDKLSGGLGNDMLTGGAGQDIFVFDAKLSKTNAANKKANLDKIVDFYVPDDTIHLAKSVFTKLAKKGALSKGAFYGGAAAHDKDDRVIYNKKTGALFYDQDGNGGHAAIQFATLSKNLKLTHKDFFVV